MNGEGLPSGEFFRGQFGQPAERHEIAGSYTFDAKAVAFENHTGDNEDAFFVDSVHPAIGVFGGEGNEIAARIAAGATHDVLGDAPEIASPQAGCNYVHAALVHADQKIRQQSPNISTAGVALKLFRDTEGQAFAAVAWVGDSRAYRLRDGALTMLTVDHDLAAYATSVEQALEYQEILSSIENIEQANQLPPQLKKAFAHRYKNSNSLGGLKKEPKVSAVAYPVMPGDKYLVLTDGISDNLTSEQIEAMAGAENAPDALITYAQVVSQRGSLRSRADDMAAATVTVGA